MTTWSFSAWSGFRFCESMAEPIRQLPGVEGFWWAGSHVQARSVTA